MADLEMVLDDSKTFNWPSDDIKMNIRGAVTVWGASRTMLFAIRLIVR